MQNPKTKMAQCAGFLTAFCILVFAVCIPYTSAHEVYLLDTPTIAEAVASPSPNPLLAYVGNEGRFFFWGFVAIVVTLTIFFATTFRRIEAWASPFLMRLKRVAHPLVRITVGATLIVFGYTGALYGLELPFDSLFGSASGPLQTLVFFLGAGIVLGFQTRMLALAALLIFFAAALSQGLYVLTYVHHAAAYLFLILVGGGAWTIDRRLHLGWPLRKRLESLSGYAFPLLRIGLGASIMFAAFYAKFLHSNLALSVVTQYNLAAFFPFDPLFIVLGAFIIEFLAGLMLLVGFEIRWTGLFLLFWLTLAHLYFPEPWWVHISLYGFGIALFCHGYDRYTLEGWFFKKRRLEPAL